MTPDELGVLVELNGEQAIYDARIEGLAVSLPMRIVCGPRSGHYLLQRVNSEFYFAADRIIDMKRQSPDE